MVSISQFSCLETERITESLEFQEVCLSEPLLRTALVAINDLRSNHMRGKIDNKYISKSTLLFYVLPLQIKTQKQYPAGIYIFKINRRSN